MTLVDESVRNRFSNLTGSQHERNKQWLVGKLALLLIRKHCLRSMVKIKYFDQFAMNPARGFFFNLKKFIMQIKFLHANVIWFILIWECTYTVSVQSATHSDSDPNACAIQNTTRQLGVKKSKHQTWSQVAVTPTGCVSTPAHWKPHILRFIVFRGSLRFGKISQVPEFILWQIKPLKDRISRAKMSSASCSTYFR